ncbi:MAG: DUF3137 domain-containing protein [Saprospiraceae bacterium]|nr:DUF3137 domain-containing protein [Lewinella sp.]
MEEELTVKRLEEFRLYYNHTIHPELVRQERARVRILRLIGFSFFILLCLLAIELYIGILVITLFLSIPIVVYIGYLIVRVRQFIQTFKPSVVRLILDFMSQMPNYSDLEYSPDKSISKKQFLSSGLFATKADYFLGEDHIQGQVSLMEFEMSELLVRQVAPVGNRLDTTFEGVFLLATFSEETQGVIRVWPRHQRQYHTRAIKEFTWEGGKNVDEEILNAGFREQFVVYATEDTHVVGILSEPMQAAILDYTIKTGKDIYIAFENRKIYAGITEPRDLLEPSIFYTNLRFDLIREFYEDIYLILRVVMYFDQTR